MILQNVQGQNNRFISIAMHFKAVHFIVLLKSNFTVFQYLIIGNLLGCQYLIFDLFGPELLVELVKPLVTAPE